MVWNVELEWGIPAPRPTPTSTVCWSEGSMIEVKVGGAGGDDKTPDMGDPSLKLSTWVIKKTSHPLIVILNYKNYPTIELFQTTSNNLVISPPPSPGQLATFWTTRQGEPSSRPHPFVALGLYSVLQFFQITVWRLS